jgi:hypothetical protein
LATKTKTAPKKKKTSKYNEGDKVTAEGRCMKCKEQRTFKGVIKIWSNGMAAAAGACPVCKTTINRILGKA